VKVYSLRAQPLIPAPILSSMRISGAIATIALLLWSGQAFAQSTVPVSNDEISKETENPVTRQITLPLRYHPDFDQGPFGRMTARFAPNASFEIVCLNR